MYFLHSEFLSICACPENRVALKFFTVLKYFLPFRIFEKLALALEKQSCHENFHCVEYTFYIQNF